MPTPWKCPNLLLEKLAILQGAYAAQGLKFEVVANSSTFTKKATNAVLEDLGIAILLVAIVMLLFLHSIRNAAIVLVSIPTSVISTFVMMHLFDYSLNLMSLLGLSLAIGILVDDAIVVIENIYRHLEMGKNRGRKPAMTAEWKSATPLSVSPWLTWWCLCPLCSVPAWCPTCCDSFA